MGMRVAFVVVGRLVGVRLERPMLHAARLVPVGGPVRPRAHSTSCSRRRTTTSCRTPSWLAGTPCNGSFQLCAHGRHAPAPAPAPPRPAPPRARARTPMRGARRGMFVCCAVRARSARTPTWCSSRSVRPALNRPAPPIPFSGFVSPAERERPSLRGIIRPRLGPFRLPRRSTRRAAPTAAQRRAARRVVVAGCSAGADGAGRSRATRAVRSGATAPSAGWAHPFLPPPYRLHRRFARKAKPARPRRVRRGSAGRPTSAPGSPPRRARLKPFHAVRRSGGAGRTPSTPSWTGPTDPLRYRDRLLANLARLVDDGAGAAAADRPLALSHAHARPKASRAAAQTPPVATLPLPRRDPCPAPASTHAQ